MSPPIRVTCRIIIPSFLVEVFTSPDIPFYLLLSNQIQSNLPFPTVFEIHCNHSHHPTPTPSWPAPLSHNLPHQGYFLAPAFPRSGSLILTTGSFIDLPLRTFQLFFLFTHSELLFLHVYQNVVKWTNCILTF